MPEAKEKKNLPVFKTKYNPLYKNWDEEKVIEFFKEAYQILIDDDELVFIGQLALKQGSYKEIYPYLVDRFSENCPELSTIKKAIDQTCETRLITKAVKSKINPVFAMFLLKCNHGYIEEEKKGPYLAFEYRLPALTEEEQKRLFERAKVENL